MEERFAIRVLSERTGVGASTLRAWERRYGLLSPERTPKGHRLYGEQDVEIVERVVALLDEGHALSEIASRIKARTPQEREENGGSRQTGLWDGYLRRTLAAIRDFSSERVEAIHNEASSLYPVELVTERLIEPVLSELGRCWQERESGIAEEHFYASWLRNRLGARFHHALNQAAGVRILCAGVPGSHHEIGLMLFAISALTRGYRVLYFGPDLPLEQIPAVVRRSGARGVVLASRTEIPEAMEGRLAALIPAAGVPVLLGGPVSDRPVNRFEAAGGVRLGPRIGVALKVLGAEVPVYGGGHALNRRSGQAAAD